jgi:surfeit locus 1 family protein
MPARRIPIVPLVLLTGATATFIALGTWQLNRLADRRAANGQAMAQRALPALSLNTGSEAALQRRVTASGRWDYAHEVVLRGQARRDAPGVVIATPLIVGDQGAVLVVRGFAPSVDAMTVALDSLREGERGSIRGIALALESQPDSGAPLVRNGHTTWRRLDSAAVANRLPYPLLGVFVVAEADPASDAWPRRVEPPPISDGPHLSYALQWFGFALVTIIGGGFWLRGRRNTATADELQP